MRETRAESLSDQSFACTYQWLLTAIRRNPSSSHGLWSLHRQYESNPCSHYPLLVLQTRQLFFYSNTPPSYLFFRGRILLCRPGWPWTCDPPDPTPQVYFFFLKLSFIAGEAGSESAYWELLSQPTCGGQRKTMQSWFFLPVRGLEGWNSLPGFYGKDFIH